MTVHAHRRLARPSPTQLAAWVCALTVSALAAQTPPPTSASPPAASVPPAQAPASPPPPGSAAPAAPPQTSAPAQAAAAPPPAAQPLVFEGSSGIVFNVIKPDKAADFEAVMSKFFEALTRSSDVSHKQLAASWRVLKATEPAPGGAGALYLFLIDPVVPNADYSGVFILKTLHAAFPSEAADLQRRFSDAYAGNRHVLTLTPVVPKPAPRS